MSMNNIQIKPVIDEYGSIEWIIYREFYAPILILSDAEMTLFLADFKKKREAILKKDKD